MGGRSHPHVDRDTLRPTDPGRVRRHIHRRHAYGSIAVMFIFGTWPAAIRVISFIDLTSMTETEFDAAFATYAVRPSGVSVTQSGDNPPSTLPSSVRSGSEYE